MMEWMRKELKDCFKLKSGEGLTAKKMIEGDYPVYGGNSQAGTHNQFNLSGDNVIIGRVGALCGNARHITDDIWLTDNAFKIIDKKFHFDNGFLTYLLNYRNLRSLARQAAQPVISNSSLAGLELEFPVDIDEQKRIVAILDQAFTDIDKARAKTEQNLKNARELFESYLQQVFSQRGEGSVQVPLSEITKCISDGDHSAPPKSQEGIPFITISNIDKSTREIDFSNTFKVPEEYYAALKETRKPMVGDVLFTVTGSYGIPVIVREQKEFCFQRHIGLVRPNDDVDSNWLYYLLMSPQVFKQADDGATGTAQKTVSLKLLRSISVPRIPLDVQKEMSVDLDDMYIKAKKLETIYQLKLKALDELKKSILQKAFSGELTKDQAA